MATMTKPLKLTPIFFFFFSLALLLLLHTTSSQQFSDDIDGDDEAQEYVLDGPARSLGSGTTRSVFLKKVIKKGTHCNPKRNNVCDGVKANNGTSLLYCCKTHCRNILGDRNNCGRCGKKCAYRELCCNSVCTNVDYNANHCGKCNKKCAKGLSCDYGGTCGYA